MKKFYAALLFLFLAAPALFAGEVNLVAIKLSGTKGDVSSSSAAWTAVPATNAIFGGRNIIAINNYAANSSNVLAMTSNSSTVPTDSTASAAIQLEPGEWLAVDLDAGQYLWVVTQGAAAQSVGYQEWTRR